MHIMPVRTENAAEDNKTKTIYRRSDCQEAHKRQDKQQVIESGVPIPEASAPRMIKYIRRGFPLKSARRTHSCITRSPSADAIQDDRADVAFDEQCSWSPPGDDVRNEYLVTNSTLPKTHPTRR